MGFPLVEEFCAVCDISNKGHTAEFSILSLLVSPQ